jgi:hypothetical protein
MNGLEATSTDEHVYRFRSIENLIGERQELDKQQIYFASQDQLNDPLEGHINIYWQGDPILWRNLFENYLNCVLLAYNLWCLFNKQGGTLGWEHIAARDPHAVGILPEHHELEAAFFNDKHVDALVGRIIDSRRKIGRNELTAHLRTVHYFVVSTIHEIYRRRLPAAENFDEKRFISLRARETDRIKAASEVFDIVEATLADDTEKREAHYIDILSGYEEADLFNYYTDAIDLTDTNRAFIFNDFCQAYVRRLGTLMYPPWYAACFMEDCSAASMWAYYGQSHTGVCLRFKTERDANGTYMNLDTISSYNAEGKSRSMRPHHFQPVDYKAEHITLNFFESLGAAPIPVLNAQWFTNGNREISPFLLRTEEAREVWRKTYWERFGFITKTKTESWRAERERRLVYYSMIDDLGPGDRTLKYDFSSLEGIIFGVRTSTVEKIKIMRIIEKKCCESARSDFKFYQANFSSNQNEMVLSEIVSWPRATLLRGQANAGI